MDVCDVFVSGLGVKVAVRRIPSCVRPIGMAEFISSPQQQRELSHIPSCFTSGI